MMFRAMIEHSIKVQRNQLEEGMTLFDIVMKLIGPVQPVGETVADMRRLENMEKLIELVDLLLFEIYSASSSADRQEFSMKKIGMAAREFIQAVKEA